MITKYGDDVSHIPVVKTINNMTGDETLTDGSATTCRVYIVRKNAAWFTDKAGFIAGGDAVMLADSSITVNINDKVTWKGNTYRVHVALIRNNIGGNTAYTACQLFLI